MMLASHTIITYQDLLSWSVNGPQGRTLQYLESLMEQNEGQLPEYDPRIIGNLIEFMQEVQSQWETQFPDEGVNLVVAFLNHQLGQPLSARPSALTHR